MPCIENQHTPTFIDDIPTDVHMFCGVRPAGVKGFQPAIRFGSRLLILVLHMDIYLMQSCSDHSFCAMEAVVARVRDPMNRNSHQ